MRIQVDQRLARQDTLARGDLCGGHAPGIGQHRHGRGNTLIIGVGIRQQIVRYFRAQRIGQGKAPGRQIVDLVPFEVHRAAAFACGACETLGQQGIDQRHFAARSHPGDIGPRAGRFARIGCADRLKQSPLFALADIPAITRQRTDADDVGGSEIRVDGASGQGVVPVLRIDVLNDGAGRPVFSHAVQQTRSQRCKGDGVHPFRRRQPAGQCPAQHDVAPARYQRPPGAFQRGTHQ